MVPAKRGLIVNISHWAAQKRIGNAIYGVSKAATDKLTADTARELDAHGVTVVSLYPGMVRTEAVLAAAAVAGSCRTARARSSSAGSSPRWRSDPRLHERTGSVLVAAALPLELGVTDIDGRAACPA